METVREYYKKEIEAKKGIRKVLQDYLPVNEGYIIRSEVQWGATSNGLHFDIVVEKDNSIIAIFEIKHSSNGVRIAKESMVSYVIANTTAHYFIIYNIAHKEYLIFDRQSTDEASMNLTEIAEKIKAISSDSTQYKNNDTKYLQFYKSTEKILDPEFCRKELGKLTTKNICRYSSLESIFSTIKYKTFRMNGLPGMNDKTEGLFAWNMLYNADKLENDELRKRMREINNAFIVSFSQENEEDDLTLWRLYGDDAKGVCCVYSIIEDKIKDRFFLHNIKYITTNGENEEIEDSLLENLRKYTKNNNLTSSDLSPTIFFYKPKTFEVEKEVRLLVDNKETTAYKRPQYKKEWVLTNSNKIPNPYIDIPLNEFPLRLEKIILGPNMSDIDTIQAQLETMLEQQNINASVELSKISGYRNPIK